MHHMHHKLNLKVFKRLPTLSSGSERCMPTSIEVLLYCSFSTECDMTKYWPTIGMAILRTTLASCMF